MPRVGKATSETAQRPTSAQNISDTTSETDDQRITLDKSQFPDACKPKQTQAFAEYVNNVEGADPDVLKMYSHMRDIDPGDPVSFSYTSDNFSVTDAYNQYTGKLSSIKVKIPKMDAEDLTVQAETTAHEYGHLLDVFLRRNKGVHGALTADDLRLELAVSNAPKALPNRLKQLFDGANSNARAARISTRSAYAAELGAASDAVSKALNAGDFVGYKTASKACNALFNKVERAVTDAWAKAMNGVDVLEDIYDAITGGEARDRGIVHAGHGSRYYSNPALRSAETWANCSSISLTHPGLWRVLEEEYPGIAKSYKDMVRDVLKGGS